MKNRQRVHQARQNHNDLNQEWTRIRQALQRTETHVPLLLADQIVTGLTMALQDHAKTSQYLLDAWERVKAADTGDDSALAAVVRAEFATLGLDDD